MIDETTIDVPHEQGAAKDSVAQQLLHALGDDGGKLLQEILSGGADSSALIKMLAGRSDLSPEYKSLLDVLSVVNKAAVEEDAYIIDADAPVAADHQRRKSRRPVRDGNVYEIRDYKRELRDLRTVNDTVAAALGACAVCWGGDDECEECFGDGQAGSAVPDRELFEELVVPAIRQMRAAKQRVTGARKRERR